MTDRIRLPPAVNAAVQDLEAAVAAEQTAFMVVVKVGERFQLRGNIGPDVGVNKVLPTLVTTLHYMGVPREQVEQMVARAFEVGDRAITYTDYPTGDRDVH